MYSVTSSLEIGKVNPTNNNRTLLSVVSKMSNVLLILLWIAQVLPLVPGSLQFYMYALCLTALLLDH